MLHWLNNPPCLCGHTINFEKSKVFVPKSVDVASEEPFPPCCGRLLRTAPYIQNPLYIQSTLLYLDTLVQMIHPIYMVERTCQIIQKYFALRIFV